MVTGKAPFVASILDGLGGAQSVIVGLERNFRQSDRMRRKEWVKGVELLAHKGLRGVGLRDHLCGGATDGRFQFGFGHGLGTATLPTHVPDVQRSLRHYLDGGVRGNFKRVKNEELLHLSSPCRLPVWHERKFLREEGLLPTSSPDALVACPSYFTQDSRVLRKLAPSEVMRVYQIPLCMEGLMILNLQSPWPFEMAASPVMYSSIFNQLWGMCTGGGCFE